MSKRFRPCVCGAPGRRLQAVAFVLLTSPALLAPAPAGALEITGRVIHSSGSPIAKARVELQRIPPFHERALQLLEGQIEWEAAATVQTSADGGYRLVVPKPGMWQVRIESAGRVPVSCRLAPLLESEALPVAVLEPDVGLEVRIENEGGSPLPGAQVWARILPERNSRRGFRTPARWTPVGRYGLTDEGGRIRLARKEGQKINVRAFADGFLPAESTDLEAASTVLRLRAGTPVTIRVETAAGEPVAGAAVIASSFHWLATSTDERGEARLFVDPVEPTPMTLRLATGQLESTESLPVAAETSPPRETPISRTWRLPEPAVLTGKVIDLDTREALPGALVWSPRDVGAFVISDAAGKFRLTQGSAAPWFVTAAAAGFQSATVQASGTPDGPNLPTLALSRAVVLEGTVVDPDGRPIAGAVLSATRDREPSIAFTEGDGSFRLGGLNAGQTFELATGANGYAPDYRRVTLDPERSLEIVLQPGRSLIGRLVTPDQEPVAAAQVYLVHLEPDPRIRSYSTRTQPLPRTDTDAEGRFRFDDVPRRIIALVARRAGLADKIVREVDLTTGEELLDLGDLEMDSGVALRGHVRSRDGDPIANAELHISTESNDRVLWALFEADARPPTLFTNAKGEFTIDGLSGSDPLGISLHHEDYVGKFLSDVDPAAEEPLEIVLEKAARVSGRVLDENDAPAARVRIVATTHRVATSGGIMAQPQASTTDFSGAEGEFELRGVLPGAAEITAAPGQGWIALDLLTLEVEAGEERENVVVRVSKGATLAGTVLDSESSPVEGAWIQVRKRASRSMLGHGRTHSEIAAGARTDADGEFRVEGLHPETREVVVTVQHPDYAQLEQMLDLGASSGHVVLTLEKGASLVGVVLTEAGAPVDGAQIEARETSRPWMGRDQILESNHDGSFEIIGLAPGVYEVLARKSGFAESSPRKVEIRDAVEASVVLRLEEGGTIRGRILGLEPHELRDVEVVATGETDGPNGTLRVATGLVAESGEFRIQNVGFAEGRVSASSEPRGQSVSQDFTLAVNGGETWVDLDFEVGSNLSGVVRLNGEPLARASILIHDTTEGFGRSATDAAGRFLIRGLEDGSYLLRVIGWQDTLTHSESVLIEGDTEVGIDVSGVRVTGLVVAEPSLDPIAGATVLATVNDDLVRAFGSVQARTAADGRFELFLPAHRRVSLRGRAPGLTEGSLEVATGPGAEISGLELRLERAEAFDLEVSLWNGLQPDTIMVALVDAAGNRVLADSLIGRPKGFFRMASAPSGTWKLLVASGASSVVELMVSIPGPAAAITLPQGATISVVASTVGTVRLISPTGRPLTLPMWNEDLARLPFFGEASIPFVPPGDWIVEIADAAGTVRRQPVTAGAGQTIGVTFD